MAAAIVHRTFNLMAEGSYAKAVRHLRDALANHPQPDYVDRRPILAVQTGKRSQPARWIHLQIVGPGGASPTVIIRDDNAYLVGFINKDSYYFELGNRGDTKLLHRSTLLGFRGSYQSLLGGSMNIPTLALGRNNLIDAAMTLWNYSHAAADVNDDDDPERSTARKMKEALARLVVALCEGSRFPPVFDAVNGTWDANGSISIAAGNVTLINNWENVSTALFGKKLFGDNYAWPQNLIKIGIVDKGAALQVTYLILNKPPPPPRRLLFFLDYLEPMWHVMVRSVLGLISSND